MFFGWYFTNALSRGVGIKTFFFGKCYSTRTGTLGWLMKPDVSVFFFFFFFDFLLELPDVSEAFVKKKKKKLHADNSF
jgi:hypothetical protein